LVCRDVAQLNGQTPPACETAARLMMSMPLQFVPGTKFSYSNLNYCLLGLIINKTIKQNGALGYENFIKQNFLLPLGISDMQLGSTQVDNKANKEVTYYAEDEAGAQDGLPYSTTEILQRNYADGGWIASAPDLVKILQALYNNQILTPQTKKIMTAQPQYANKKSGYPAMGWDDISFINGKRYISKIGSFTGTETFILQSSDGVSYAVLFNVKRQSIIEELKKILMLIAI
jgi:CubicO group peptidase (beta-lactamase class C family)